ncbi:Holliday junction resolvasome RuvABC endonuclease subunit [Collimonas sp. OK607]|nr:Holliday junction resolvasome RuvABC endonuclease subunit [Collimonas sp. OK607]
MTKNSSFSHSLTQLTTDNVNLLHVRACAPKEKLCCSESAASDRVGDAVEPPPQIGGALTVLAIDLGTTTGWALRSRDHQIAHGFVSLRPQRFEGGGMRYLRFKRWLSEIKVAANDIHAVYFEEVRRHAGVDAAHVYGGLMATLTAWCEHHNIPYQGVPVGTIKKHATGKGNAGKEDVIVAMRAKGHPVTDDNEADALALLHWAIETQEA